MKRELESEFREFVAARSKSLLHTAYLLCGDWDQAQDLLQGALTSTALKWAKIRDRGQAEAYVRRAVYNSFVDRTRLLSWKREYVTAEPPDLPHLEHDLADAVARRQDLVAALRRLPRGQRAVIVLRYFEDRTDAETAHILGITEGTVRSQRHRALSALRVSISDTTPPLLEATA